MRAQIRISLLLLAVASPLWGQAAKPPETHVVTVTVFSMPFDKTDDYFKLVDKYFSIDKENPHILSEKYLQHDWGNADQTIWVITEYKDMGEIQKATEWGDQKFREMIPDSTARDAAGQEFLEKLGEGFNHHTDNIL